MPMKRNKTFLLLTLSLFVGLLILPLVQDGMFFDGVTYSAISKNMANGHGNFFEPHYTKILYPSFHEHPPLVFFIESFFFKLFGNAFYTERIFGLVIIFLSIIGIIECWKLLADSSEMKAYYWLPILFWLSVPIVSWSYKNNLLENTMSLFSIYSVYFILKALIESKIKYLIFGSILVVLAFLSKGFVGVFPLVTPLIFGIVFQQNKKSFWYFLILITSLSSISLIIISLFPEIVNNISKYFQQQLLPALRNNREITTDNRFKIILNLIIEISIPFILALLYVFIEWRKKNIKKLFLNKNFILFALIAISASFPLIITLKQRSFFLIPSIPFYALALSFFLYQFIHESLNRISAITLKWLNRIAMVTISSMIIFSAFRFGEYSRDEDKLKDIYIICNSIPEGTILSTTSDLWTDWALVAYLSRIGYLSLDKDNQHEYFLIEKSSNKVFPDRYEPVDLKLVKYTILKRNTETTKMNHSD
jgi:4-amino-4-deoxy-L-arabinose transferase-like glycosyltransferase